MHSENNIIQGKKWCSTDSVELCMLLCVIIISIAVFCSCVSKQAESPWMSRGLQQNNPWKLLSSRKQRTRRENKICILRNCVCMSLDRYDDSVCDCYPNEDGFMLAEGSDRISSGWEMCVCGNHRLTLTFTHIHTHTYTHTHTHMYTHIYTFTHTHAHTYTHAHTHTHTYACTYTHTHIHSHAHAHTHTHTHTCAYAYVHIRTHLHTDTDIKTHT